MASEVKLPSGMKIEGSCAHRWTNIHLEGAESVRTTMRLRGLDCAIERKPPYLRDGGDPYVLKVQFQMEWSMVPGQFETVERELGFGNRLYARAAERQLKRLVDHLIAKQQRPSVQNTTPSLQFSSAPFTFDDDEVGEDDE